MSLPPLRHHLSSPLQTGGVGKQLIQACGSSHALVHTSAGLVRIQIEPTPADAEGAVLRAAETKQDTWQPRHSGVVQVISFLAEGAGGLLASVDSRGDLALVQTSDSGEVLGTEALTSKGSCIEPGWHGVSFLPPSQGGQIAVASYWDRRVQLFDLSMTCINTCNLSGEARAVKMVAPGVIGGSAPLTFVTHRGDVSVYDFRLEPRAACISRINASPDRLLCVDAAANLVGCAGDDHAAHVIDCRKWSPIANYRCMNQPVTGFRFAQSDSSYCYAVGTDAEILIGQWAIPQHGSERDHRPGVHSWRAGKGWLGIDIVAGSEIVIGASPPEWIYWMPTTLPKAGDVTTAMVHEDDT